MEQKEIKTYSSGLEHYNYGIIRNLFVNDKDLHVAWCKNCGIALDDDRSIYGWPKHFELFYAGYCAAKTYDERQCAL